MVQPQIAEYRHVEVEPEQVAEAEGSDREDVSDNGKGRDHRDRAGQPDRIVEDVKREMLRR